MYRDLIFSIGSLTDAIRTKKLLAKNGVGVSVVKLDAAKSRNGCAYGIQLQQRDMYTVAHILTKAKIMYNPYSDGF